MRLGLALRYGRPSSPWWPAGLRYAADFSNDRYMSQGLAVARGTALAFARSTPQLAPDSQGVWHGFAPDVPALTDLGLWLEPAATNWVPNAAMAGAQLGLVGAGGALPPGWSAADFATVTVTATGTEAGLPFLELRLQHDNATASSQFPRIVCATNIAAEMGEHWTASCFYKRIAGAWPAITGAFLNVEEVGTTTAYATADRPGTLDTRTRLSIAWTTSSPGVIALHFRALMFNLSPGEHLDVTLRLYAPQLAMEAALSSPILTSGAAASRAADAAVLHLPAGTNNLTLSLADASDQTVEGVGTSYALNYAGGRTVRQVTAT